MDSTPQWIDRTETLAQILRDVGPGPLALDTEADSLHHYPEKVCLVQLSFDGRDYLVDPLSEISLDPLGVLLADGSVTKVLHGADYDIRMLHRGFGITFRGLFDTMVAARIAGESRFGLAALLEQEFDVPLNKKFQRADWSRRPLTAEMVQYATMDTQYLIRLQGRLSERLAALGRTAWAQEEFERLEAIRAAPPIALAEGFRKVKGGGKLERRQLAILRELWSLRETRAIELDRPPFRVMHDDCLIELSVRAPADAAALRACAKVPRPWREGSRARALREAIDRALALASEEWPTRTRGKRSRGSLKVADELLVPLRDHRDRIAAELELESSLLGPRAVLEQIVERIEAGADPRAVPDLRRWQWELLAPGLPSQAG